MEYTYSNHSNTNKNNNCSQLSNKSYPSRTIVHAKLEMTEPGDHDEQEADAVANTIAAGGKISRKLSGGSGSSGVTVSNQMESQLNHLQGGGQAMPTGLRSMMESGFGQDFSHVRLHTDSEAASMSSSIHAKAFTHGNDIYFNQGQFSPNTTEGQKLMAHELTHVVQGGGKVGRRDADESKCTDKESDININVSFNSINNTELGKTATGFLQYIDPQTQISKNIKVTSGGISNSFGVSIHCFFNSCDYIPQGDYEILDNNGRTDSFRLEFKDDKYDDKVQGGREFFRLHKKGQGNTIGCISVDDDKDWDELYKTLKPDKTSYNTCKVESKSINPFSPNYEQINKYGTLHVEISYPSQTVVHPKLEMTEPGDHDEQEADAVANTIAAGGKISRKISGGSGSSGITVSNQMESQLNHLQGGGQAMPSGLRSMMESGFGQDFSHVRLHTDSEAASLSSSIHAKAFTYGNDIYFNQGQFSPNTAEGQKLMAHELTHTIQNSGEIVRRKKGDEGEEEEEGEERSARLEKEKRIRGGLYNTMKNKGFTSRYITISKNQNDGLKFIDIILSDCESLIEQMNTMDAEGKNQVVQQVYNTLTQVASTMDILIIQGKDNPTPDWTKTRDLFTNVVRNLANKAHNPAIAVLMYEGTYYNGSHKNVLDATKNAAKNGSSYMLSRYGAVCNNAAWGSLIASDVTYEFAGKKPKDTKNNKSRISGLKRPGEDRLNWSDYNLIGSGNGEKDALNNAQQGDVIIFWNNGDPSQNADASHIEIIVDVRNSESGNEFLLSGAHNSNVANGIERDNEGKLNWKNAKSIRNGRIMRLLPIDRSGGFIPVNLSNMQYDQQIYTELKNEKNSTPPIWENSLNQVTINWLSKQDVVGQEESFAQTFPMSDFNFNISPELCLDPEFLKILPIEDQKKIMDMSIKVCPSFQDLFLPPLNPKFFEPSNNSFPSNYVPPIKNNSHKIKLPDIINKGQISDFYYLGINWKNWSLNVGHTNNFKNLKEFWLGIGFELP